MRIVTPSWREWCAEQHRAANHKYAMRMEYEVHLLMTANEVRNYQHLIPPEVDYEIVDYSAWGHDLLEDLPFLVSYNVFVKELAKHIFIPDKIRKIAEICFALQTPKGRNREERHSSEYYREIQATPGAVFVKLCDRLANVRFGLLTNSRQLEMYRGENTLFLKYLGLSEFNDCQPMVDELHILLDDKIMHQ